MLFSVGQHGPLRARGVSAGLLRYSHQEAGPLLPRLPRSVGSRYLTIITYVPCGDSCPRCCVLSGVVLVVFRTANTVVVAKMPHFV